jgi:hypothetical protein
VVVVSEAPCELFALVFTAPVPAPPRAPPRLCKQRGCR